MSRLTFSGRVERLTSLPWKAKANAVAKDINDAGGQATAIPGDMLNAEYINELVKKSAEFGGGKIHIIVNNAGFTWDGVTSFQYELLNSGPNISSRSYTK